MRFARAVSSAVGALASLSRLSRPALAWTLAARTVRATWRCLRSSGTADHSAYAAANSPRAMRDCSPATSALSDMAAATSSGTGTDGADGADGPCTCAAAAPAVPPAEAAVVGGLCCAPAWAGVVAWVGEGIGAAGTCAVVPRAARRCCRASPASPATPPTSICSSSRRTPSEACDASEPSALSSIWCVAVPPSGPGKRTMCSGGAMSSAVLLRSCTHESVGHNESLRFGDTCGRAARAMGW
jgi:hypothetical protein